MRPIDLIVLHCSATPNGRPVTVAEIRGWHLDRGWKDIGYHFVVYLDGSVVQGRPIEHVGAHAAGHNATSVGICLVGGTGGPDPLNPGQYTPQQWTGLVSLLDSLRARYPDAELCGHRDLSPYLNGDGTVGPSEWIKLCPSFDVSGWVSAGMVPDPKNILTEKNK